ncbi:G-protein coupled receptor GRL101-like [Macrobrachium nipponense]|uniref:G-protein coupled receptor GRL101-like n=1 Tax=Macrobrachium nipponense TaxID=159736 RepID=UPI0030C7B3C3
MVWVIVEYLSKYKSKEALVSFSLEPEYKAPNRLSVVLGVLSLSQLVMDNWVLRSLQLVLEENSISAVSCVYVVYNKRRASQGREILGWVELLGVKGKIRSDLKRPIHGSKGDGCWSAGVNEGHRINTTDEAEEISKITDQIVSESSPAEIRAHQRKIREEGTDKGSERKRRSRVWVEFWSSRPVRENDRGIKSDESRSFKLLATENGKPQSNAKPSKEKVSKEDDPEYSFNLEDGQDRTQRPRGKEEDISGLIPCNNTSPPFPLFHCGRPGECVPLDQRCNGVSDCTDGADESVGECGCLPNEFQCDETCIDLVHRCDMVMDCPDGADERNCETYVCPATHFKCNNHFCVPTENVCDFHDHCGDGSDEHQCHHRECWKSEFECANGQCIRPGRVCDGHPHCRDGSDETRCSDGDFAICGSGARVHRYYWCDGWPDCTDNQADELHCGDCDAQSQFECPNSRCISKGNVCDSFCDCQPECADEANCSLSVYGRLDGISRCSLGGSLTCMVGNQDRSRDRCISPQFICDGHNDCHNGQYISDEYGCVAEHVCLQSDSSSDPEWFRCDDGRCLPSTLLCDFKSDCLNGEDEFNCSFHRCRPGQMRCGSGPCLAEEKVCDGNVDCPLTWDDEDNCPFSCSSAAPECECRDISISCFQRGLTRVPGDIEPQISRFDLSNNSMTSLPVGMFLTLSRLRILDLRHNFISTIANSTFLGLANLRTLHMDGNRIMVLEPWGLYGLSSLSTLDLSQQFLKNVTRHSFLGLRTLLSLNISHNQLQYLPDGTFSGLSSLLALDVRRNQIAVMGSRLFTGMTSLDELWTDEFRFCCLARHVRKCQPQADEFSSCEDLMTNVVLRVCVWLLGVLALTGNFLVIVWRIIYHNDNKVHSFLITNLALGDLCMGLYLLIIAAVDVNYRGVYFLYDAIWRTSTLCQLAGFFSTFSSELSVFTLTVITLERFVVIMFPFRVSRLSMSWTKVIMGGVWVCVGLLAALPLVDIHYFRNFYGRSGVCLALHITHEKPNGWEYSVFVFLVLNFVSFCVIALSYWGMYRAARSSSAAVRSDQQRRESSMARRMTVIVVTDAACWLPIILLGIVSLAGVRIPPQVFAWVAVFVLPLNAAINPLLYTLSTAPFLGKARERVMDLRHSVKRSVNRRTLSNSTGITAACEMTLVMRPGDVTPHTTITHSPLSHSHCQSPSSSPSSNCLRSCTHAQRNHINIGSSPYLNNIHHNNLNDHHGVNYLVRAKFTKNNRQSYHRSEGALLLSDRSVTDPRSEDDSLDSLATQGEIIPLCDLTSDPGSPSLPRQLSRRKTHRPHHQLYD